MSAADRMRRHRALRDAGFRMAQIPVDVVAIEAMLIERQLLGEGDLERDGWEAVETALALYLETRLQKELERMAANDW